MTLNRGEKEIFRAKEENFQDLIDYKKSFKPGKGAVTTRKDFSTGEWVLIYCEKNWAGAIIESAAKSAQIMDYFEEYLLKEV